MRGVSSNPVSANPTPSNPSQPQASSSRQGLSRRLDPSTARLAGLPANAGASIAEQVIYEVRSPAALADRILARPDDSFWLLGYQNDRPRPLEQAPQRFFQVSRQGSALVVREENGNERECALGADRSALIGFLADAISGPRRLYLSVLQPPTRQPLSLERSAEQPSARQARPGLDASSALARPALNEPVEQADPTYRPGPALTSAQRQAARSVPRFTGRRQGNAPALPPAQVQALLGIAPEAFCHNVEDFQLGFRVLMTISQGRLPQDQRDRCERQAAAMLEQAQAAAGHWPEADFRVMTFLCNDCKGNARHHPALLGVLASLLLHHSAALKTETMGFVANCLSHYRGGDGTDRGRQVKSAAMKLAERFSATGQRVADPKDLSLLANCFSKWPNTNACATALSDMARGVYRGRLSLASASAQSLGILANAWSKNADDPDCAGALAKLASELVQGRLRIDDAQSQHAANLANAWSWHADNPDCAAALAKLAQNLLQGRLQIDAAQPQHAAILANAWSKQATHPDCAGALAQLARDRLQGRLRIDGSTPQDMANLAGAWSKLADNPDCAGALAALARDLLQGRLRIDNYQPPHVATLANAWSKNFENADCAGALAKLARDVLQGHLRIDNAGSQAIANLANGWSKQAEQPDCARALARLASDVLHNRLQIDYTQPQHSANLANAWSKCAEDPDCAGALAKLARDLLQGRLRLDTMQLQHVANLANAWSKCAEAPDCARALAKLAQELRQGRLRIDDAQPLHVANLANAWAKCPESPDCANALAKLARDVLQGSLRIDGAKSSELANLANAWSKHAEQPDCAGMLAKFARNFVQGRLRVDDTQLQHVANLANAWAKRPEDPDCAGALTRLARDVLQERLRIDDAQPQHVANLVNAWTHCDDQPECRAAINRLVAHALSGNGPATDDFTIQGLALLAHALARNSRAASAAEESDVAGQSHDHLIDLALRLEENPAKFEEATTRNLAMFLRALGRAGLRDERRRLAPVMLQRLEQLHKQTPPFQDASLETFGHLAIGLRPLALQSQRKQRTLRGQTLQALDHLQPVIARALAQQTASADDTHQSRLPAVSVRYLFETYAVVANTLKPRHLPRVDDGSYTSKALHERRQALKQWLTAEEARLSPLFEGSNDVSLWDLQTRLRAPGTGLGGGLDRLIAERASDWRAQQPPSVFDVRQALANMDHPPRTPKGDVGIFQPPRIDVRGRPLEQTGAARYHVLTHLTGGKLPYAVVELANKPTLSTLEHPITYQDQSWRIDLTGGSRMKKGQVRASNVMKAEGERPGGPQLMALRLSDTLPGSAYDDLARALMPAREDFFRFQRMFLSSPPEGIPGLKPQDHVLQGNFRIGILPDRPGAHTFRFNDAQGRPIALQPHDGCGFIRQSLLEKLPACQRAWGKGADGKAVRPLPPFATRDPGNLPGQALQHYPRNTAVAKEVQTQLVNMTAERPPESDRLFRAVATGLIQGPMAVVVPSADNRVHLSTAKAGDFQKHGGGVLIGRSPYDKPNLRPLTEDRVATAEQGDPTAAFLDHCTTLQYSYVGDQAKADGGQSALFATKGLMVGIPDELWPDPDTDIVMSAQDVKTHSDWKAGKQRVTEDTLAHSKGLLVANEVFTAGSVIAMPRAEQQRLDGDFDGDTVVLVAGRPQLFEHVRQFDERTPLPPTLKPPKTHSTPFDAEDDHYQHGRSKEIMPVYAGVMEQFSGLQTRSLAQPVAVRDSIATRMLYGSFEGLPKGWKRQVRAVLEGETLDAKKLGELRQGLLDQQRTSPARRVPARALEAELLSQLEALQRGANAAPGALPTTDEVPGIAALREDYREARTSAARVEALLNCYPERQLSSRVGYEKPDNPQLCLQNLLSLGIKAGTDAYKSQTGVYEFSALGRCLDRLLRSHGTVMEAPYTKGTASRLAAKRFDIANTQRELKDNPTLAASVMSAALAVPAVQKALQDQQPDLAPSASDRQRARQLATELQARAQANHGAVASTLEAVLGQTAAGTLFERGQECKGRDSMLDKILRNHQVWGGDDLLSQAKNVNDALRFHVELDDQHFTRQYRAIMDALDGQGARRVRTVNCFNLGDKARYKGINVTRAVTVNGETVPFEIQFHSPQSRAMKKQCHGLYKDAQKRQVRDDQQQRIETLEETMRQRWSEVPNPPGVERIGNSGGDWPAHGLWATLTANALPDEPLDEEDESGDDEDAA